LVVETEKGSEKKKASAASGVCAEAKTRSVSGLSKVGVKNEELLLNEDE
jgi:hypothetical protein